MRTLFVFVILVLTSQTFAQTDTTNKKDQAAINKACMDSARLPEIVAECRKLAKSPEQALACGQTVSAEYKSACWSSGASVKIIKACADASRFDWIIIECIKYAKNIEQIDNCKVRPAEEKAACFKAILHDSEED